MVGSAPALQILGDSRRSRFEPRFQFAQVWQRTQRFLRSEDAIP